MAGARQYETWKEGIMGVVRPWQLQPHSGLSQDPDEDGQIVVGGSGTERATRKHSMSLDQCAGMCLGKLVGHHMVCLRVQHIKKSLQIAALGLRRDEGEM